MNWFRMAQGMSSSTICETINLFITSVSVFQVTYSEWFLQNNCVYISCIPTSCLSGFLYFRFSHLLGDLIKQSTFQNFVQFSKSFSWLISRLNIDHIIQINQPIRCKNFSSFIITLYVQLNMFLASSRQSSGAQQLR